MFEEPCGIATQRTTSYEVVMLCPAQGSREATLSSDREASFNITARCAQEGIKGGNKRRKQHLQGTITTTSRDNDHNWEVGSSDVRRISTAARSDKHLMRPPIAHFKRLLEEAYPNHSYPIRHKLKYCGMMRSFMTSRSLTWGAELNKGPDGSDTTPFPEENAVMTVYGGRPPSGRLCMSSLSPRAPTHCGWGCEGSGV
jgi:hypothetical protein